MQDDARPDRVGAVKNVRQQTAQNEGGDQHNGIQMRYSKDRGAEQHGSDPAISFAESLKEKAPEKNFLHQWGHDCAHEEKPNGVCEAIENFEDLVTLRINAKHV